MYGFSENGNVETHLLIEVSSSYCSCTCSYISGLASIAASSTSSTKAPSSLASSSLEAATPGALPAGASAETQLTPLVQPPSASTTSAAAAGAAQSHGNAADGLRTPLSATSAPLPHSTASVLAAGTNDALPLDDASANVPSFTTLDDFYPMPRTDYGAMAALAASASSPQRPVPGATPSNAAKAVHMQLAKVAAPGDRIAVVLEPQQMLPLLCRGVVMQRCRDSKCYCDGNSMTVTPSGCTALT